MTLKALYETLVGSPGVFDARHRIVNGLALVAVFVTLTWAASDIAFGRIASTTVAALALASSAGLYVYSRLFRGKCILAASSVLAVYLVIFAVSWFDEGGVMGSSAFLVMLILPATILVFSGWYRWLAFSIVIVVFAALTGLEAFYPGIRLDLSVSEARGGESIVAFLAGAIGTSALFTVAVRSLRTEVRRVHDYSNRIGELARLDPLTGLLNHTATWTALEGAIGVQAGMCAPLSLVMLDLDDFKSVNDVFGHRVGDEILRQVGGVIQANLRSVDVAGRYGGEEFLVVLPDTDAEGALRAACRLLLKLSEIRVGGERRVMATAGVVQYRGQGAAAVVDDADRLLYTGKRLGGGRVVEHGGRIVSFADCGDWQ